MYRIKAQTGNQDFRWTHRRVRQGRDIPVAWNEPLASREGLQRCARIYTKLTARSAEKPLKISREDVVRVAELAYLELSDTELENYRKQIDEILEYIGKLDELDTSNVGPMAQVLTDDQTADATLREDVEVPCGLAGEILKQAPDPEPPYFRVPKVIER